MFPYCSSCKGTKNMCGLGRCPILDEIRPMLPLKPIIKGHVETETPPGIFVGEYGYPSVYAGPTALFQRDFWDYSRDKYNLSMEKIISIHSNVYRTGELVNVRKMDDRIERNIMESSSTIKPVEISFEGRMVERQNYRENFFETPVGPLAMMENLKIQSNPKIPGKVDYFYEDPYIKANEALWDLYDSGMDVSYLQNVLSAGIIGVKRERRMVPTKWSITAVDDILFKNMKNKLIHSPWVDSIEVYSASFLGNDFNIILIPGGFSFEMLEKWNKGSLWGDGGVSQEYEGIRNRTTYASSIAGAYYAARYSVVKHLYGLGRQGKIIVIRSVGSQYYSPLGVWVIRRTTEEALKSRPIKFQTTEEMLRNFIPFIKDAFSRSKIIRESIFQKSLEDF
ncbi:Nre family DNA repair protein [Cuniculiplasma sp. SKW4]|uniref:Nre family DNA repair protein n=1 Tax=Cuniculiplasma sp. SKW4 TaxID=3400171 RepID=UPI003FD15A66